MTGASGFVGAHLLRHIVDRWKGDITAVSRQPLSDLPPGVRLARVDVRDSAFASLALRRGAVVVNLAYASDAPSGENLAIAGSLAKACFESGAARVVHVSTATVVGDAESQVVTEATPCRPVTDYQRTKLTIEQIFRDQLLGRTELVILRPTAVFGEGGKNLQKLAAQLTSASRLVTYAQGCLFGRRAMNLVPVETVIAAIEFAATDAAAAQGADSVFIVADDEARENNFRDVEQALRWAVGASSLPLPRPGMPRWLLARVLKLAGRWSMDPYIRFSDARLRDAGFVRPVTFCDALARYTGGLRLAASRGTQPS